MQNLYKLRIHFSLSMYVQFYSLVPLITEHVISVATTLRPGIHHKLLSISGVLKIINEVDVT
jgi:hypothetical protein